MNGSRVVAHDKKTGTSYIMLPPELQTDAGTCQCSHCRFQIAYNSQYKPMWNVLAVPTAGYAWTVHMPNPVEFQKALDKLNKDI